ncbi:MAG: hypothetical protein HY646_18980 [Acidobacteria bacterium]|nr:hypothetical protein [Acidobacteriota bacterium]
MRVQFMKKSDGSVVLRCHRSDGSTTWQRHEKNGVFFSFHDITHFAVETTLGFRQGFYGLLADGWDIAETDGKGPRGKLPAEGILVEHIVGLFDRERAPLTAAEFNEQLRSMTVDLNTPVPSFTEAQLAAARKRIQELHCEWAALAPGSVFELSFGRE